jgi:hypothetical protein
MRLGLWLGLFVVGAALIATFVYLARSRARVMRYHGIETPRSNEMTHGGGGGV